MNPHFTALEAAYQLHYYLWFKTHYLQPILSDQPKQELADTVLANTCSREQLHLLESDIKDTQLRLLLSLKPSQTISEVVRKLKGNLQHQSRKAFDVPKLFGKGYFARSSGRINLEAARNYVEQQAAHHGYQGTWTKPLKFRNPDFKSPAFAFEHCAAILNYHLVLVTQNRIPVFDEVIAPRLFDYLMEIGSKYTFAIDRIGLLPDHMHLIIEGIPSISVEEYVLAIMNSTHNWMMENYWGVLKETGAWDVWRPSYYAGTVGEYTTAQISNFLRND
jgi:REP-associated tyrosine transposase